MNFNTELAMRLLPGLMDGLWTTILLLVPTFVLGFLLSIPLAIASRSSRKPTNQAAIWYVAFMRGAPQLLLLYFVYNGFPYFGLVRETFLWTFFKEPMFCAIFVFVLNHAAFLAEIWRGALKNVPKGLVEAAHALGTPGWLIFMRIEFPLAFRIGLPAYRNEVVLFLKATAVVGAITIFDILGFAKEAIDLSYDPFTPLVMAGLIYWIMVQIVQFIFDRLEWAMRLDRRT
jgi:polar amino acid transport system permease protein